MPAVRHFLDAIKFEHTVFALPFAYVAMVLAADGWPGWRTLLWVTLAMAGARTLAMAVNRLADRFTSGVLFHTGPSLYSLSERIIAVPIAALWA